MKRRDANDTARKLGPEGVVKMVAGARKRDNARETPKPWEDGLAYTKSGSLAKTAGNVALFLLHHPAWTGTLAFNEMKQSPVWRLAPPKVHGLGVPKIGSAMEDTHFIAVQQWLQVEHEVLFSREAVEMGALAAAKERSFHPVRDYLDDLTWDGTPRLDRLLIDYAGAEDSDYVRAVTGKSFIAAVARVRQPGAKVDTMLVLEGKQGLSKSEFFRVLASDDHFDDHLPDLRDKDALLHLSGLWIVEVAELDALKGQENSRVKSFLSRRVDRYRPPYARHEVCVPRTCVFFGTTNGSEYLADATGGRRFWPVTITRMIDLPRVREMRDQLWAEADHRFAEGEEWHLDADLERDAAVEQDARFVDDPWKHTLERELAGRESVVVDECWRLLGIETNKQGRYDGKRLAAVLMRLGFARKRVSVPNSKKRPWLYVRNSEVGEDDF